MLGFAPLSSAPLAATADGAPRLAPVSVLTGAPSMGAPAIQQTHILNINALSTASPFLGSPSVTLNSVFGVSALWAASPIMGSPALTVEPGTFDLVLSDIATGAPSLEAPDLRETSILSISDLTTGVVVIAAPSLLVSVSLEPRGVTTGAVMVPVVAFTQLHNLVAPNIGTGAPVVGQARFFLGKIAQRRHAIPPRSANSGSLANSNRSGIISRG